MFFPFLAIIGALLIPVGLMNLGKLAPTKSMAGLFTVVGALTCMGGLWATFTDPYAAFGPTVSLGTGATLMLFGILYVMAGLEIYHGGDFKVTGWFCGFGGLFVLAFGLGYFNVLGTHLPYVPVFGVWFMIWGVAFELFFIVTGLGVAKLGKLLGWWLMLPVAGYTLLYATISFINFGI